MIKLILRILGNALALYAAVMWVPGFSVTGGWKQYLIAALVLSVLNMIIRPILKVVSFPIILLTLGLFTAIINILMLAILAYFLPSVSISSIIALIWATVVVSIVNFIVSLFAHFA